MCDLLWSDPEDRPGWEGWNESPRGAGCLFGMDRVLKVRFCIPFLISLYASLLISSLIQGIIFAVLYEHISWPWKGINECLTITSLLYGLLPIIAIAVEIKHPSCK